MLKKTSQSTLFKKYISYWWECFLRNHKTVKYWMQIDSQKAFLMSTCWTISFNSNWNRFYRTKKYFWFSFIYKSIGENFFPQKYIMKIKLWDPNAPPKCFLVYHFDLQVSTVIRKILVHWKKKSQSKICLKKWCYVNYVILIFIRSLVYFF